MSCDALHERVLVNGAFGVDDVIQHGAEAGFVFVVAERIRIGLRSLLV